MASIRTRSGRNPLAGIERNDIEKPEPKYKHHVADVEKETIILFNEAEPEAEIFTYNRALQRHLKNRFKLEPVSNNGEGGLTFRLDKTRLRFPQPKRAGKKLSPERKAKLTAVLKKARENRKQGKASLGMG